MSPDDDFPSEEPTEPRPQTRQFLALHHHRRGDGAALGVTLQMPSQLEANDISRWCTVWSLLERGTYAIDKCPWQVKTQDKVKKASPFAEVKEGEAPIEHFYSSKPPLLPTLIAGILYPFRQATGVPLDEQVTEPRNPRNVLKPGATEATLETPRDPVKWNAYVFYFKPTIVLLNTAPLLIFLILYARLLDRYAPNDWAWSLSLVAAAWGTQLVRLRHDPEQPHGRRLQRLLRDLPGLAHLGGPRAPGRLRPLRVLRRLLRLQ